MSELFNPSGGSSTASVAEGEEGAAKPKKAKRVAADPVTMQSAREVFEYVIEQGRRDYDVQRYKGLGEMTSTQLWETTMNPATRTLKRASIENAAECDHTFSMLMGDEVAPRREFIEKNAKYARIDI